MNWTLWIKGFKDYITANLGNINTDDVGLDDHLIAFKENAGANQYDRVMTIRELIALIEPTTGFVPYTGATTNVDLGDNTLDTKRILQSNNGSSIFIGEGAGENDDLSSNQNVFIGYQSGKANTNGGSNTMLGFGSGSSLSSGNNNTILGQDALGFLATGYNNVSIGAHAGEYLANGTGNTLATYCIYIGNNTKASIDNRVREIVIGNSAIGNGSNTATIGDDNITDVYMNEDGQAIVHAGQYRLSALNTAPTSAADTGTLGEIRYDADYMYVCVATDTWKRSLLETWGQEFVVPGA